MTGLSALRIKLVTPIVLNAALTGLSKITSRASGGLGGVVQLLGLGKIIGSGRMVIIGSVFLTSKAAIVVTAKGIVGFGTEVFLQGRTFLKVTSAATVTAVLQLKGQATVQFAARLVQASGPIQTGYEHIVKFIQNVGHMLIR